MDNKTANRRMSPTSVIVVYGSKDSYNRSYYLEQHAVTSVSGKPTIMEGRPLDEDLMRDIAKSYSKDNTANISTGGWIESHMLYGSNKTGSTVVMWYRPCRKTSINFTAALKTKTASLVNVPATLYVLINSELYIYALMTDVRPERKTKIYQIPFYNINQKGHVCLGTAYVGKSKAKTFELEADRYERGFYSAAMTHASGSKSKTAFNKLWPALIKSGAVFPSKTELLPHGSYKTLGDIIDKLIGKHGHE